jgi:hypothetical protein
LTLVNPVPIFSGDIKASAGLQARLRRITNRLIAASTKVSHCLNARSSPYIINDKSTFQIFSQAFKNSIRFLFYKLRVIVVFSETNNHTTN